MKTYPLLILLCSLRLIIQAQTPCVQKHKGEVLLRSAKGKNAKGIIINIDGNNGTPTDQNGIFSYTLSKCPGQNVKLKVSNEDYGMVNHLEMGLYTLRRLADPNDFQFSVIVSPSNQVQADRIAYYSPIIELGFDKEKDVLKGRIKELEKVLKTQLEKNDRLVDSLATLRTRYAQANQNPKKRRQEIEEIAKIFAQQTEVDLSYIQAFKLYQDGKLVEALRYLSDEKMQEEKQRFLQKEALARRLDKEALARRLAEEAQREQEFYISKSLFKATIYQNLFDMKSSEHRSREAATTLSSLGSFYDDNNRPAEAEKAYQQAMQIIEQLVQKNPDQYEPDLARTLNNLGLFYKDNNRPIEANELYEKWSNKVNKLKKP